MQTGTSRRGVPAFPAGSNVGNGAVRLMPTYEESLAPA